MFVRAGEGLWEDGSGYGEAEIGNQGVFSRQCAEDVSMGFLCCDAEREIL